MAMTNAERQKAYRDRRRGGPPVGRWPGGAIWQQVAGMAGVGRTMAFMAKWICQQAPDLAPEIDWSKVGKVYRRLRAEYERGLAEAISREVPDSVLTVRREDGRFVFEWVEGATRGGGV